jgi:hypothetical protein
MPEQDAPGTPTTWVVLSVHAGRRLTEYVHGDRAVKEADGSLSVFNGATLIRRFAAGAWESYAEWVTATWNAISKALPLPSRSLPSQREDAESRQPVHRDSGTG